MTPLPLLPDHADLLRVTCAPGVSPYLEMELRRLGFEPALTEETGVEFSATLRDAMRLCLGLRTAFSVMYRLAELPCRSPADLYDAACEIAWDRLIPSGEYVCVDARGTHPAVSNWNYVNQRIKDAIVDRVRDRTGARPNSGPSRHGVVVNAYWLADRLRIFLNVAGNKLADRGYRRIPHVAPMQETLAAAVLMAAGYAGQTPLVNPMCGSGTLAIEAALIARNRAPGLLRSNFGVMHVVGFDSSAWESLRREAAAQRRRVSPAKIIATDIDPKAIDAARRNAQTAGVDRLIDFSGCDFADTPVPPGPGVVILNPPYGERLGDVRELERTYARVGDFLKQRCAGYEGYVFTGNRELAKHVGLAPGRRMIFWNARIECRLLRYELFTGSRRDRNRTAALDT